MRILLLALVALLACAHTQEQAAEDARDRQRAEVAACWSGTWPPWLDDRALADAERLDRWGAMGSAPNDSFRTSTLAAQPDLPPRRPSDVADSTGQAALLEERAAFRRRCDVLRKQGNDVGLVPAR